MNKTLNLIKSRIVMLISIVVVALSMTACAACFNRGGEDSGEAQADTQVSEMEMAQDTENMMEADDTTNMSMLEEEVMEPEPLVVSDDIYVVAQGDNLWYISGLISIYDDPFRWPLIYAHNRNIDDADLIYPGQELAIKRDLSRAEIDSAVLHAKNRGVWAIGEIETTDVAYRSSAMSM